MSRSASVAPDAGELVGAAGVAVVILVQASKPV